MMFIAYTVVDIVRIKRFQLFTRSTFTLLGCLLSIPFSSAALSSLYPFTPILWLSELK